jgi:hypothetical protein
LFGGGSCGLVVSLQSNDTPDLPLAYNASFMPINFFSPFIFTFICLPSGRLAYFLKEQESCQLHLPSKKTPPATG